MRNKFTWRADSTTLAKYTREYRIKASTGTKETKNKIIAGQYVQPVTEWIFPELLTPGLNPPALDFTGMTNLVNGIVQDDQQFGQLNPWPGASAPSAPSKCTVQPDPVTSTAPSDGATFAPLATPAARVPANFTHIPGSVVTLSGSNNASDIPEGNLTYSWTQVSGPTVTLVGADKAKCSFTAAAQAAATPTQKREFKLTVSQRTDLNVNDTAIVAATGDRSVKDVVSIDSYTTTNSQGGTISVTAHSNVVVDASAALKLFLGTSTTALTMTSQGGGVFSYSARSVKKPASIRTTSVYGGSATTMATTSKRRREFSIGSEQGMVSRIKRGVFDWRS